MGGGKRDQDAGSIEGSYRESGGGGSASGPALPSWGGRYPETCTSSKAGNRAAAPGDPVAELGLDDPRVAELRECGLSPLWIRIAEIVGFERFIALWSMLDRADPVLDDRRRLYVPCIEKTLLRHQRDRIISAMALAGMGPAEIQRLLGPMRANAGISLRTIERIHARAIQSGPE